MIQVESKLGVQNLDAILTACPDIDIVWLGTLDCRISMGLPSNNGMGGTEPEWMEVLDLYEETMAKHDKPRGGFAFSTPPFGSAEGFKKACGKMAFVACSADVMHLMAMSQDLATCRSLASEAAAEAEQDGKGNGA
jgi:4-hydroxy-2-oxoheptanedioate aldolase